MGLEDKKETKAAVSFENHENKIYREPRPFAATAEELEAHKAFWKVRLKMPSGFPDFYLFRR